MTDEVISCTPQLCPHLVRPRDIEVNGSDASFSSITSRRLGYDNISVLSVNLDRKSSARESYVKRTNFLEKSLHLLNYMFSGIIYELVPLFHRIC